MPNPPPEIDGDAKDPRSTISGTVTKGNSQPVSGVIISLTGASHGHAVIEKATTADSGGFSFKVLPGDYTISPTIPPGDRIVGAGCTITVSGGHPATVSFMIQPPTPPE